MSAITTAAGSSSTHGPIVAVSLNPASGESVAARMTSQMDLHHQPTKSVISVIMPAEKFKYPLASPHSRDCGAAWSMR